VLAALDLDPYVGRVLPPNPKPPPPHPAGCFRAIFGSFYRAFLCLDDPPSRGSRSLSGEPTSGGRCRNSVFSTARCRRSSLFLFLGLRFIVMVRPPRVVVKVSREVDVPFGPCLFLLFPDLLIPVRSFPGGVGVSFQHGPVRKADHVSTSLFSPPLCRTRPFSLLERRS